MLYLYCSLCSFPLSFIIDLLFLFYFSIPLLFFFFLTPLAPLPKPSCVSPLRSFPLRPVGVTVALRQPTALSVRL